ncbi:MAG: FAD-dependent thymidylate synthase [Candidatus Dojkabacteria bacterium]|nr:FAD-dependent thymidylate synthase [Candidatus Dojkabacteria bacterium]
MKLQFRKDLGIASIVSEDIWNSFKIHTLLQNTSQKRPSINAYLGARYSRSADSIVDIAKEIIEANTDASERLEKIFAGYGHKSVGDMADLFLCIENIPMYSAFKIFYTCPVISGQERSTRYQNFEKPEFVQIPKELCQDSDIRKEYENIILKQMQDYRAVLKPTTDALAGVFKINEESPQETSALKARAFDVCRYLLPLGLNTSSAYLMSARNWSELISYLCASDSVVENQIADMLLNLLGESDIEVKGYIKEADNLIRHTDANCCRKKSTGEILKYLSDKVNRVQVSDFPEREIEDIQITHSGDSTESLISHYELLLNPLGSQEELEFSEEDQERIGEIIFDTHDHHNLLGNIGQFGSIKISGFASYGTLKDLNRHRSMERFVPLFHDEVDLDQELDRPNESMFFLCNYLDIKELSDLKKEYSKRLTETYSMIKQWREKAKEVMSLETCNEFTKYLFPHAHSTKYVFYASFDDIQYIVNLRTRNGGHIAYRTLVYEWLRLLSNKDEIWRPLLKKIIAPRIDDKHQFVDRS